MEKSYFGTAVKQYFKHFFVLFIILAVAASAFVIVKVTHAKEAFVFYESPNTERVYGAQRVFDYGNQLSESEEAELEAYIHEAELKTCCDIVIVTLDESLRDFAPEYKANYDMAITPDKYVMVYADKFWEDNKFGYDQPQILDGTPYSGDGVILVDNCHREEETGKIYTWMATTGVVERTYSAAMIDYALDEFYYGFDYGYCYACKSFVDCFVSDMTESGSSLASSAGVVASVVVAVIVTFIFILANMLSEDGKVTTNAKSYLIGGSIHYPEMEDIFLRKSVTKVYNPPQSSSSGGGGGHHVSGGGGSHGGGGHSR